MPSFSGNVIISDNLTDSILSIGAQQSMNSRIYLPITIGSVSRMVLFDPGATCSYIREVRREWREEYAVQCDNNYSGTVSMANRGTSSISGRVQLPMQIKGIIKEINFLIIPELNREILLGIDVWRIFRIVIDGQSESWWLSGVEEKFPVESRDRPRSSAHGNINEISDDE
ncbi:hypothetical protein PV328_011708 [Microctonus aethiopoides]|uniref:Peptidase A2 domain-containing protein n=1 Tax=Microctonus aethiopoides TaxID=144406 RepID=A0AA39KQ13_9HYME|nr:hypothetical protein PV328_011708 [Microctonus aethiopoides]